MSKFRLLNVLFVFSFASIFSPVVSAITPENADSDISLANVKTATLTPIESDKYLSMKTYFRHLFKNMPENDFGSCGFVSLVSCLSYYDSYYNDTIIDEKYDVESSGVLNYNFGYNYSNYSCVNINNQEFYIAEAGRLDVSEFSEMHSANYVVNGRPYCGCGYSE